jgi:hypothetical protein
LIVDIATLTGMTHRAALCLLDLFCKQNKNYLLALSAC